MVRDRHRLCSDGRNRLRPDHTETGTAIKRPSVLMPKRCEVAASQELREGVTRSTVLSYGPPPGTATGLPAVFGQRICPGAEARSGVERLRRTIYHEYRTEPGAFGSQTLCLHRLRFGPKAH